MADSVDKDVPPLEDMSDQLDKLRSRATPTRTLPAAKPPQKCADKSTLEKDKSTFGGLKKGFLSGISEHSSKKSEPLKMTVTSTASTQASSTSQNMIPSQSNDDIPFVKAKSIPKRSILELPEVQENMKETSPLLQTQNWMTEDLISKVENHPNLSKVFQDPNLTHLLDQFQKDPQRAMEAAKDNKEMQSFLKDFCEMMGDHFTSLADKDEVEESSATEKRAPLISEINTPPEEEEVKQIMSKPEVKEALEDRDIQKLIFLLKSNPNCAHRMVQTASPLFHQKIQILIQNGLLAIQH